MTKIAIPTLDGRVDFAVQTTIERIRADLGSVDDLVTSVRDQIPAAPPTLEDYRTALSATGSNPLNLTGLVGAIDTTPLAAPPPSVPTGGGYLPFDPPHLGSGDVHVVGKVFRLASTGAIWPWRGCTDFLLYKKYLDGTPIAAVIANRVASGANLQRVLGMASNITTFFPSSYPNYYTALPGFAALLAASGLSLEFVVFADAQVVMPTQSAQMTHFNAVIAALAASPNVFIEFVNEYQGNGATPTGFTWPAGLLSSAGSGDSGTFPFLPPWDYLTYHSPRDDQWVRKSKDLIEIRDTDLFGSNVGVQRPVVADEPMGAADVAVPGSRSNVPNDFYWYAALAQMMGAGATFHSDDGIQSVVFDPIQQGCANSFYQGLADVPPASQLWQYTRGGLADCPIQHNDAWSLRTFAKLDNHNAVALVIRPTGLWPGPLAVNGWTVASTTGPVFAGFGTLVFLTK